MVHVRSLAVLILIGMGHTLAAQSVRLNAYGGYTFADKFNFDGYPGYDQAKVDESDHWGFGLEVEVRPLTAVEIYYQWQNTTGRLLGTLAEYSTDVKVEYLMLGGLGYGAQWFDGRSVNSYEDYYYNRESYAFSHAYFGSRTPLIASGGMLFGYVF